MTEQPEATMESVLVTIEKIAEEWPAAVAEANKRMDWVISFMAMTDRYHFEILGRMIRVPTLKVETAAVGPKGIQLYLLYNPLFFAELTDEELRWVLTHEVAHVVLHHTSLRSSKDSKGNMLQNIAADMAVNSLFGEYPGTKYPCFRKDMVDENTGKIIKEKGSPIVVLPEHFGFERNLSMEQYEGLLHKAIDSGKLKLDENSFGGQFDWHLGWGPNAMVEEQVRQWVQGIERSNSWGHLGGDAVAAIRAAQKTEVPWYKVLRHYYGLIASKDKVSTYKRPSRRMWYPWVGKRFEGIDKVLVAIDTSGSISDESLSHFLAETNSLARDFPVDLVTWDTKITLSKAQKWNPRQVKFSFQGRGGTDAQPALDFAKEHHYQSIVMFTDGYFGTPNIPAKLDVLWLITPEGTLKFLPQNSRICMMSKGQES